MMKPNVTKAVRNIGAFTEAQAVAAARAVFECRAIVESHSVVTNYSDEKLYALELALHQEADRLAAIEKSDEQKATPKQELVG